jgi:predicted DNA-binding transcriptional regulator AlpA
LPDVPAPEVDLDEGETTVACGPENWLPAALRVKEVARFLGVLPATVWRLAAGRDFPRPVKIGRCTRWRREKVEEWLTEQEAK